MDYTTTVTQKGQITLPKVVRDSMGIATYSTVKIEKEKDYIKVTPLEDIFDIEESFKVRVKKSVLKAREFMEKGYVR